MERPIGRGQACGSRDVVQETWVHVGVGSSSLLQGHSMSLSPAAASCHPLSALLPLRS